MKRYFVPVAFVAALILMIAWRLNEKKTEAAVQVTQQSKKKGAAQPVVAIPVRQGDMIQTFTGLGTVEAPLNVRIAPKVTGRIEFLEVREGDAVTAGQVVARINASEIEAEVRQEQANVAEARSRLAQAQITQNPTTVSVAAQIRTQEAAVASARAEYNQERQNLTARVAAAQAEVRDARSRVESADAAIGNAGAAIRNAQANLENAQTRLTRITGLYKQGFIAAQEVDDARAAVKVQEGALDIARGQLETAQAQRRSAVAQRQAAERQVQIVSNTGKADIAAARARLDQAQAALRMARANTAQTSAYRQNLAALRAAVDAAEAQLRNAQARRADTVLRSPINGIVSERLMDPGSMAGPGQPILTVQDLRQVWLSVPVPEEVRQKLSVGQPAQVTFDSLPGRTFNSTVGRILPTADPQSRQFTIRLTLDNPQRLIQPGMFGRVSLITERIRSAVIAPREAVQQTPEGATVVVMDAKGEAQPRPVTLGASDPTGYVVEEGLEPGEKVVVMSAGRLKGGEKLGTGEGKSGKGTAGEGKAGDRASKGGAR